MGITVGPITVLVLTIIVGASSGTLVPTHIMYSQLIYQDCHNNATCIYGYSKVNNKLTSDKLLSEACLYINKGVIMPYILHAMYTIALTLCIHTVIYNAKTHIVKITMKYITVAIIMLLTSDDSGSSSNS